MSAGRPPSLKRGRHVREPKWRFIIFCEGAKTEPTYFAALQRRVADALIETREAAGVPRTLAQAAIKESKALRRRKKQSWNDEVWAVFDRDEHERYQESVNLCEQLGVGVGRSDPCFELWLILHGNEFDKPDGRHAVQAHLQKIRPEYNPAKGKTVDCADLVNYVEFAEKRAEAQLARRESEGTPHGRPSTTVGRLTRRIRQAAEKAR